MTQALAREPTCPFVGHGAEIAEIRRLIRRAASGVGAAMLVEARAGLGKSRLLAESAALCNGSGAVLMLACAPQSPIAASSLRAQLTFALPAHDSDVERLKTADIELRLRALAARRHIVCLVDDLHRAKREDIIAFEALLRLSRTTRLLLIATYLRDGNGPSGAIADSLQAWSRDDVLKIDLQSLDSNECEMLLRQHLGSLFNRLTLASRVSVFETSGGSPRYIEELAQRLRANPDIAFPLPPSAEAKVATLRATLMSTTFAALRLASVLGDRFEQDWLVQLGWSRSHEVCDVLQQLVDSGVLREVRESPSTFTFEDPAIRSVLYDSLVTGKRRRLHASVAAMLVAQRTGPADDVLIATHWYKAEEKAEAIRWLVAAGGEEERRVRAPAAVELYRRASLLTQRNSELSWEIEECLARTLAVSANFKEAIEHRRALARHFIDEGRWDRAEEQLFLLMFNYWYDGRIRMAEAIHRKLHRRLDSLSPDEAARTELGWAELCIAAAQRERALAIIESIDPVRMSMASNRSQHQSLLAQAGARSRPLEETMGILEGTASAARESGRHRDELYVSMRAANTAAELGETDMALDWIERTSEIARLRPEMAAGTGRFADLIHCELLLLRGRIEDAREALSQLGGGERYGSVWESYVAGFAVFIGMRLGDASWVAAYFRPHLLELAIRARHAEACGVVLRGFAETMAARDMHEMLSNALQYCVRAELVDPYYAIQLQCARYGALIDLDAARRQIERDKGGTNDVVVRASLALFDAFTGQRANRVRVARDAGRAAATIYRALRWEWMEAVALEAAGDRSAAAECYRRCEAARDVARLAQATRRERRAAFGTALTSREHQVAGLVASGLTNRQISIRLSLSECTINHHVEAIFRKRGIRARWQLSAESLQ